MEPHLSRNIIDFCWRKLKFLGTGFRVSVHHKKFYWRLTNVSNIYIHITRIIWHTISKKIIYISSIKLNSKKSDLKTSLKYNLMNKKSRKISCMWILYQLHITMYIITQTMNLNRVANFINGWIFWSSLVNLN